MAKGHFQKTLVLAVQLGRIQAECGCEWDLLKARKGKYKGTVDTGGVRRERVSALQVLLKPTITYGKRRRRFPANNHGRFPAR
jgi:hypothetical protein